MKKYTILLTDVASALGLKAEEVELPNTKKVMQIVWKPAHLPEVFRVCDEKRTELGLGRGDLVVVDGPTPTWLLPCISHAFHPTDSAVKYPQGGPDAILPLSGVIMEGAGKAEGATFTVTVKDDVTVVEYALTAATVDAAKLMASLVAPEVPLGKAVRISGRGPVAIAAALGEAYAHRVPSVAFFQPGTGYVVAISHDGSVPLGTVTQ